AVPVVHLGIVEPRGFHGQSSHIRVASAASIYYGLDHTRSARYEFCLGGCSDGLLKGIILGGPFSQDPTPRPCTVSVPFGQLIGGSRDGFALTEEFHGQLLSLGQLGGHIWFA